MFTSIKYTAPKEDDTFVMKIPTKADVSPNPADDREIDLSELDEQDVKSLHKSGEQPGAMVCHSRVVVVELLKRI